MTVKIVGFLPLALLPLLMLANCGEKPPPRVDPPSPPSIEKPASPVDAAKNKLKKAIESSLTIKENGGSEVDQLKADKAALVAQRDLARAEADAAAAKANELDKSIKAKDVEISDARDRATQERIYWFAGILGFVGLIAGGVAFAIPVARSWAGGIALACGIMAGVAVFAAWAVPYLWWIGAVVVVIAVIGLVIAWKGDSRISDRLVRAVDRVKGHIPDYKDRLRAELGDIDLELDKRRERLGLKPKRHS